MTTSLKFRFATCVAAALCVAALAVLLMGFALASLPYALVAFGLGLACAVLAIETRANEVISSTTERPVYRGLRWRLKLAAELIVLGLGPKTPLRFLDPVIVDLHCSFRLNRL